jgi:hypothetical protein
LETKSIIRRKFMKLIASILAVEQLPTFPTKLGEIFSVALSSPWVTYILVPVLVTLGAVWLKALARHQFSVKPEDWVVGFDLGITACVTLLVSGFLLVNKSSTDAATDLVRQQYYLIGILILLFFFIVALGFGAIQMGKKGWDTTDPSKPRPKRPWPAVINTGGAILLLIAFIVTGGRFR